MIKHFLTLTTAACILACGAVVANAQEDTDNPVMQQLEQAQQDQTDEVNPDTSCPPSALVGQIRQIEEGSVSGSS